jgi:hypothetical protein
VEDVADQREGRCPDRGAEQAPREEGPQSHPRRAGQERRDRAHDADEAPDEDRLGAVAVEEALDALQAIGGDAQPRAAGDQEAATEALAEQEARQVAERGGQPGDQEDDRQVDAALRGDDAAEDDGGLAGGDEADERPGLQERERRDEQVGPRAERVREVGEDLLEVRRLDEPGRHRREGGGGEDAGRHQPARHAEGAARR